MFGATPIFTVITLIFYVFTGILIAYLWHELTPLVSKSRLILNALVWPALVMLFFGAWAVFSLDSVKGKVSHSVASIKQQSLTLSFRKPDTFIYRLKNSR